MNEILTLDKIFDVAPTCGGRMSNAVAEAHRLMKTYLNPALARCNAQYGTKLAPMQGFTLAGTKLSENYPQCVTGYASQGEGLAVRVDQEWVTLSISIMYGHIENEKLLLDCMDACYWVRAIMQSCRGKHADLLNRPCWNSLKTGSIMPGQHENGAQGALYQVTAWQPGDATNKRNYFAAPPASPTP